MEGSSGEHKVRLEKELTSALDLTPFQVAIVTLVIVSIAIMRIAIVSARPHTLPGHALPTLTLTLTLPLPLNLTLTLT